MRIVTFRRIREYTEKVPEAKTALEEWYHKTSKANWENFRDMRRTFNSVDNARNNRYVFNIKGNKFRLIAIVIFASQKVYIRFIGSHSEYDDIQDYSSI
ncbi:MAG: type II toxin-antitoxin system HigB family toxin [Imperialibacter sp.]|uniref:type II toxin-antitoxin system HigB family toxin n=1 Tax=Imperialibacter sp. TaxID=2038411 RepID=UPI0032EFABD2